MGCLRSKGMGVDLETGSLSGGDPFYNYRGDDGQRQRNGRRKIKVLRRNCLVTKSLKSSSAQFRVQRSGWRTQRLSHPDPTLEY